MLTDTLQRMLQYLPLKHIYIVSLEQYVPLIHQQLPNFPVQNIIVEPTVRDTAACIGLSALHMLLSDQDPVLITLPADHYISDPETFHQALEVAVHQAAQERCVVTLGVHPTRPETGYGYIRIHGQNDHKEEAHDGKAIATETSPKGKVLPILVEKFIEKPDLPTACKIFADGRHYWNTGTFIWKASAIMHLLNLHLPELYDALTPIQSILGDSRSYLKQLTTTYRNLKKQSIDYGVIEKCEPIYMIPVHYGWDDLGNWNALERISQLDEQLNIVRGRHEGLDTSESIIYSSTEQLISTIGIKNMVIVATEDVVLVCPKDRTHDIKKIVEHLKQRGYDKVL